MASELKHPTVREARRDRTVQESRHDTYKIKGKLPEPTVCPQCGALFHKGRWTWGEKPPEAHQEMCPACRRMHDKYPAGELHIRGAFFSAHRDEILGLARNEEKGENAEHPLSRIMAIQETEDGVLITTTDLHLPRRIGDALRHAYQGDLTIHYSEDQQFVRGNWAR